MLAFRRNICLLGVLSLPGFAACGDGGCGTTPAPGTSFALLDPSLGAADRFDQQEVIRVNSSDFNFASFHSAVHQYIFLSHTLIANIFSAEAVLVGPMPQYSRLSQE